MNNTWWWIWIGFMVVMFVSPVSYGWGYRGWGPPYPSYFQQRRMVRSQAPGSSVGFNHTAWGRSGDFVWGVLLIGLVMAVIIPWWR